jgi:hypothetical protein
MTARWKELLKDILYGAVVPLIVGFIIIAFPLSQPLLRQINPALIGILVFGLEEQILIVAVPMLFGLLWNQWAEEPQDSYSAASMPYGMPFMAGVRLVGAATSVCWDIA